MPDISVKINQSCRPTHLIQKLEFAEKGFTLILMKNQRRNKIEDTSKNITRIL